jgi:hypothetical protein
MKADVQKAGLRALQYELADGTFELLFAALFLLLAGILCAQAVAPASLWSDLLAGPGLIVVFPGAAFLLDRLARRFRERVTWPRTGYLARRTPPEASPALRRAILVLVPVLTLAALSLVAVYRHVLFPAGGADTGGRLPVFTLFFSLILAGLWIVLAWRLGLPRFYLAAVLSLAIGSGLFLARLEDMTGMAALCAAMALVLGGSGLVVLLGYLRRHPAPREEIT